jgi:putative membrane protein
MHRRQMMTAAVAASASLIAASTLGLSAGAALAAGMGEAETKHAKDTATVGSLSLATSRVAVEKASDAWVKKFAGFEVAEQETIADILMSMKASADAAEGALKKPSDADVEAMIDPEGKEALAKLKGLSGAEFDKAYVTAQLDGHKKLLVIQEDYLKVGKVREHLDVAKLARGMVKEHISHLEDLQSKAG